MGAPPRPPNTTNGQDYMVSRFARKPARSRPLPALSQRHSPLPFSSLPKVPRGKRPCFTAGNHRQTRFPFRQAFSLPLHAWSEGLLYLFIRSEPHIPHQTPGLCPTPGLSSWLPCCVYGSLSIHVAGLLLQSRGGARTQGYLFSCLLPPPSSLLNCGSSYCEAPPSMVMTV